MKKLLLLILAIFALASCTDESGAIKLLESQGYTNIQITGYDAWACGQGDDLATGFVATNMAGNIVKGTVCSGLFLKGSTIRF